MLQCPVAAEAFCLVFITIQWHALNTCEHSHFTPEVGLLILLSYIPIDSLAGSLSNAVFSWGIQVYTHLCTLYDLSRAVWHYLLLFLCASHLSLVVLLGNEDSGKNGLLSYILEGDPFSQSVLCTSKSSYATKAVRVDGENIDLRFELYPGLYAPMPTFCRVCSQSYSPSG